MPFKKITLVGLGFFLLLGKPSLASINSDVEATLEIERIHLNDMRIGFQLGLYEGRASFGFEFLNDDCAMLTLEHSRVNDLTNQLANFLQADADDYFRTGLHGGWLIGFRGAYWKVYEDCEMELQENARKAMEVRVAECERLSEPILDPATLVNGFHHLKSQGLSDPTPEELLSLVLIGEADEAWKSMLTMDSKRAYALPCQMVVIDKAIASIDARMAL